MKPRILQRSLHRPSSWPILRVRALHHLQMIGVPFPARQNNHTFQGETVEYLLTLVDRATMGYSAEHTKWISMKRKSKHTYIRNRGRCIVVRHHREGLGRLERARLVFPYREQRFSSLMNLMCAQKVECFKAARLVKQHTQQTIYQHRSAHGSFHRCLPKSRWHAGRYGSGVPFR